MHLGDFVCITCLLQLLAVSREHQMLPSWGCRWLRATWHGCWETAQVLCNSRAHCYLLSHQQKFWQQQDSVDAPSYWDMVQLLNTVLVKTSLSDLKKKNICCPMSNKNCHDCLMASQLYASQCQSWKQLRHLMLGGSRWHPLVWILQKVYIILKRN